jgi:hypothetical protein
MYGEGATSTISIAVNSKPNTPVIIQNGNILQSSALSGNQWYDSNGLINNATSQNYTVTVTGDYHTVVTLSACSSDPSNIISAVPTDVSIIENDEAINIYPNPVANELFINGVNKKIKFEIINALGQVVFKGELAERKVIPTVDLLPGVYLIKFENEKACQFKKIVKK